MLQVVGGDGEEVRLLAWTAGNPRLQREQVVEIVPAGGG